MVASGSILLFRAPLEERGIASRRQQPEQPALAPAELMTRLRAANPAGSLQSLRLPAAHYEDGVAIATFKGGPLNGRAYIDIYSGAVIAPVSTTGFIHSLVELHHEFFGKGHFVPAILGTSLIFLSLSGIYLYWKTRSAQPFGSPRRWHASFGIALFAFLIVIASTGTVFAWRSTYHKWLGAKAPAQVKVEADAASADPAAIFAALKSAAPDAEITLIRWPQKPGEPVNIRFRTAGEWRAAGSSYAFFDSEAKLLRIDRFDAMPFGIRLTERMAGLHMNEAGGNLQRALWLLIALATLTMAFFGIYSWFTRVLLPFARQR